MEIKVREVIYRAKHKDTGEWWYGSFNFMNGDYLYLPTFLNQIKCGILDIATLSDSLMPYIGEVLLDMPHRHHHIGFLEKWWLINAVAIVGVTIAYFNPSTKFPHFGHVLISTWASVFHILMAKSASMGIVTYIAIFFWLIILVSYKIG